MQASNLPPAQSAFSFGSLLVQVVERTLLAGVGRAAA